MAEFERIQLELKQNKGSHPPKKREHISTSDLKEGGGQFENIIFT